MFVNARSRGVGMRLRAAFIAVTRAARFGAGDGFRSFAGSLPAYGGTFRPDQKELVVNTASSTDGHRWRAFAVLAVSYFMTVVDLTIVNVALPTIGRKLHFSESNLQWVVTAYGPTFGGFLLLGGRAADLLGRRRILMTGLALFTAASLGAGFATSDGFLIAMRALQGLGAAVVLPAALSIVMNMFSEGADRNKALGFWGAIGGTGATVGLITGGLVVRYVGWQYIFFLNVPVGRPRCSWPRGSSPKAAWSGCAVASTRSGRPA
jgi:MFS family permease